MSKSMFGGSGGRSSNSNNYTLNLLRNRILAFFETKNIDSRVDLEVIINDMNSLSGQLESISIADISETIIINHNVTSISDSVDYIEISLNDISFGSLITIAQTISGTIDSISNEIDYIDGCLNDISLGSLLTIAQTISGTIVSISYEMFIIKKQFEYIYQETSDNNMWDDGSFSEYIGISADLSYTHVINRLDSIESSLNSIYDTSLISQLTSYNDILDDISFSTIDNSLSTIINDTTIKNKASAYKIILEDISFQSIEISLNSIYDSSLITQLNYYKTILESISFSSIDASLNSIYDSSLIYQLNSYKTILEDISFQSIYQSLDIIYDDSLSYPYTSINSDITKIIDKANEAIGHVYTIIGNINSIDINKLY